MKLSTFLIFLGLSSCVILNWSCQESGSSAAEDAKPTPFAIVSSDSIPTIIIDTKWDSVILNKTEEEAYTGKMHWLSGNESREPIKVKVCSRGNTRKRFCNMPPLKVKFDKNVCNSNFSKSLKLVTHCKVEFNNVTVLKEHLVYQLYGMVTENSFNTQLSKIHYSDTSEWHYGFFIENDEELASRLDCHILENKEKPPKVVNKSAYKKLAFFQYMVGNTDWNLLKWHNIKWFQPKNGEKPFPVGYDFDYSGFVNATYARPHDNFPIKSVRDRYFLWRSSSDQDFSETISWFLSLKEKIIAMCADFKALPESERADCVEYIKGFYDIIEDPVLFKEKMLEN